MNYINNEEKHLQFVLHIMCTNGYILYKIQLKQNLMIINQIIKVN
jgi:hypothetical protein